MNAKTDRRDRPDVVEVIDDRSAAECVVLSISPEFHQHSVSTYFASASPGIRIWSMAMVMAATPAVLSASPRPQCVVRLQGTRLPGGVALGGNFRGKRTSSVAFRSRPWRSACRALKANSDDIAMPPPAFVADLPQVFYFAVANAQSLMLEGAPLESVLQDGIERAERAKRRRDVWLVMEPAFLNQHPGLKSLNAKLSKPTAAILSTNADWMLSFVKTSLPQAAIGKFVAPSTAVPDPLKSNLSLNSDVVGGGGVWH